MNDVVFRRINGRIIPMRVGAMSPEKKSMLRQGAGEVAGGIGVSTAAGVGAAKLVKKAQSMARESKDVYRVAKANFRAATGGHAFMPANTKTAQKVAGTLRKAVGKRFAAKALFRARNPLLNAGAIGSAILIGHGVNKIRAAMDNHKKARTSASVGKAVGTIAAVATYGAYYRGLGFKKPVEIGVNIYTRMRGMQRPFKKFGKGGGI